MVLREATAADHADVVRICRASGRDPWAPDVFSPQPNRVVVVAVIRGSVVGVAKTHHHEERDGDAPAGHYLGGVVVHPHWRRQGVGSALVKARLRWIWERSDRAYYFTNERNGASIEMHRSCGFTPIASGPVMRGVPADGEGAHLILYEAVRKSAVGATGVGESSATALLIRPYVSSDAAATLEVFFAAIRGTASADYTAEQIHAWASPHIDLAGWGARREARSTTVATLDDVVVGFSDIDPSGYIDMLFVDPTHGRTGVATALLGWVVEEAERLGVGSLTTYASITARPFFEAKGFIVEDERHPVLNGVVLTNYAMGRPLRLVDTTGERERGVPRSLPGPAAGRVPPVAPSV